MVLGLGDGAGGGEGGGVGGAGGGGIIYMMMASQRKQTDGHIANEADSRDIMCRAKICLLFMVCLGCLAIIRTLTHRHCFYGTPYSHGRDSQVRLYS